MKVQEYFDGNPVRLDEVYHCNSKHASEQVAFASRVQLVRRDRQHEAQFEATQGQYKTYARVRSIELPHRLVPLATSLEATLQRRRSQRVFADAPLSVAEVAAMLGYAYGVAGAPAQPGHRPVPSGGGLYPLELYLLQFPHGPVAEGVYHYHAGEHRLQCVDPRCERPVVAQVSMYPDIVTGACALIAIAADMRRTRCKYGERAYRLALLEAGHVSQNLYLVAAALGVGVVALDGFYDDRLHALLDVDGVSEIVVLLFALGRVP